ncbi:MAG: pentapeptide repeat-containing protein [Spirochaetaceae bacterium]|jgi:uncharacterized protein YjbI with pentapeptide repeats|nr:pentapeptide repeat-containing protein [Spirochaetaceae bacterium]
MFHAVNCRYPECGKLALFVPGKTFDFCLFHTPEAERETVVSAILSYIMTTETIIGVNAGGLKFSGMDLSGKRFYGCSFQHCRWENVKAEEIRSRMSMFDFTSFTDCTFERSNIRFVSFGCGIFKRVLFTGSDLVYNNFCGVQGSQSSFNDCDLYNSRFIRAGLFHTTFINSNILNVDFTGLNQNGVVFKQTNTKGAHGLVEEKRR